MKKTVIIFLSFFTVFTSHDVKAACPKLPGKDMAYYLCPVVGSSNVIPQTTIVYQRPVDVLGAFSNAVCAISKASRVDNKEYEGVESNVVEGKLVCHYQLPENWKKSGMIDEFSLEAQIQTPPSLGGAVCPILTFEQMSAALCQETHKIGSTEWGVKQKGAVTQVCNFLKGLLSTIRTAPKGTIKGQIGEGTTAFTHTCKYSYHAGTTPKELVLHGKMSLELLRHANEEIAKH